MEDFITQLLVVMGGSAATLVAGYILKAVFDAIVKALAKANKKFGLFVIKKRKERFNANAADLIEKIDNCQKAINAINIDLLNHLRAELDDKYTDAIKLKTAVAINNYLSAYDQFINLGGTVDSIIELQRNRIMALASAGPLADKDDGSLDF